MIILNLVSASFTETFKTFKKVTGFKIHDISKFYQLLKEFKKHTVTTHDTKECKTRVMNNVVNLYNNYFDFYEKTYDESTLTEKEGRDPRQFKIVDNELPEWLESKNDFNKAERLIDNIRIDMNKVKVSKEDKNWHK